MKKLSLPSALMLTLASSVCLASGAAPPSVTPTPLILDGLNLSSSTATPSLDVLATSSSPLVAIANWFSGDAQSAVALAYQFPSLPDGNGAACWTAGAQLGAIMKAHPSLLTGKAMTDIQALRLAVMAARQICNNQACQTVAAESASALKKVVQALPVNVKLPTQNAFIDACDDIPTLASAPLPTPSPTPATTPAAAN